MYFVRSIDQQGATMNTIEKQRAELVKILAQSDRRGTFVKVVPVTVKPSTEDARKLAQLRMNYDLHDKTVMSTSLMPG
jgi:hypothetical protein